MSNKVKILMDVLHKIQEQDDAISSIATAPDITPELVTPTPTPISYGQEFFKSLKMEDEFTDFDDPTVKYRVISDPVIDEETGEVTSLVCEVIEAPEENIKGFAVGDTFDIITEMPSVGEPVEEPTEQMIEPSGKPVEEPEPSPVPKEKTPEEEPAKGKQVPASKERSAEQIPDLTKPSKTVPESIPAAISQVRKTRKFNPPDDPEKGKQVSGERLRKRGYTLRKRFGEVLAKGIVQSLTTDKDGNKIAIVRVGGSSYHLELPPSGADIGDEVEVEDMARITKVIAKKAKS